MILIISHFNSIKVQLEHAITIKTGAADLFQFHKGTIRTLRSLFYRTCILYFNSIKVQLELTSLECLPSFHRFQFHKGTIRTLE